ncbi:SRPBCC family protein [Schumannella soli]|uniref:SRPBCC family protein n=1 Tax=Schumannella soli TaxID=2590779 RepID=A0A506XX66_9MICO|nr:SRPBCC family protein [Schumannella soli]TPW77494.1 SRPBCC family protein [Schumannella soli]
MTQIIETIDVSVPVSTAYNQWTQFEEFPKFLKRVESITQESDTRSTWKVSIGGQTREFVTEITEQHPDERVAWTSTGGQVDHAGVVTFHQLTESETRVTVQIDWDPEGVAEHLGSALGFDGRAVKKELENYRDYLQSKGSADGAWRGDIDA